MTEHSADPAVERFPATNGRLSGYVGLACAAVVLGIAISAWDTGASLGIAILAVLAALLLWVVMLRPALWATDRELVMRTIFHTDRIPLVAIDKIAVGQVTAVTVGEKRYVSPVVGYTARQTIKQRVASKDPDAKAATASDTYQVFVEDRITHLAKEARERHAADTAAAPVVRRTYAWPEIAGTALLVVAFLVWLVAS
jgi:hypothetical protein